MGSMTKKLFLKILLASSGLFSFSFGVYLTIQADIGAAPWDVFELGLSKTLGITYGNASILVSVVILMIDVLMKEKIGIGMFLDAFLVGKTVDLFNRLNPVPAIGKLFPGIIVMIAGLIIMGFSQYLYMKAALGCGPRDTLLVGLSRRLKKIPIGLISICILSVVTAAGWLLGGPTGIGTLICAFLTGPIMQLAFRIMKFEPTAVRHQGIMESIRVLFGK